MLAAVLLAALGANAATQTNEQQLIDILRSGASLAEKDAACAQLKRIGTARSVPALAALLADDQLSHSARYALESMRIAEAGRALLDSLDKTKGITKVGIMQSLGARGEVRAIPALTKLVNDPDEAIAVAATIAVGQAGGNGSRRGLERALRDTRAPVHNAAVDGLLRYGNRLLNARREATALPVFEQIYEHDQRPGTRVAAYRGMIYSSGPRGLELLVRGLEGDSGPEQIAALQAARELKALGATAALTGVLPRLKGPAQLALVEALNQRGDSSAAPALAALAGHADTEVRPAILNALGSLGDASTTPLLTEFAASGMPREQKAAREALITLQKGNVADALIEELNSVTPGVQAEAARALGSRQERRAVPRLLTMAQQAPAATRPAALQALAGLVQESELWPMVELVLNAQDPIARAESAEALNAACQRLRLQNQQLSFSAVAAGVQRGSADARVALLPVCSGLPSHDVRLALRAAAQDKDDSVRNAAVRALCDTLDAELLGDIVTLAQSLKDETLKTLAVNGGVRLTTQEESVKLPTATQVTILKQLLAAATTPEQKRKALAGLAEAPDPEALRVIEPVLEDAAVKNESARAAVKLCLALPPARAQDCLALLRKASEAGADEATTSAVQDAIKQIEATQDYITDWQVAGPYRQEGKNYTALFDIAFPPEAEDTKDVHWQILAPGADPKQPFVMDLLKPLGGQQCVAYARTWVRSDSELKARLELGSDDGIKVWLNGDMVYANNTARAIRPGSDKADVTLRQGWNRLLLKITQNSQGWAFCARLMKPDGTHLEGLQCEATPKQ